MNTENYGFYHHWFFLYKALVPQHVTQNKTFY